MENLVIICSDDMNTDETILTQIREKRQLLNIIHGAERR